MSISPQCSRRSPLYLGNDLDKAVSGIHDDMRQPWGDGEVLPIHPWIFCERNVKSSARGQTHSPLTGERRRGRYQFGAISATKGGTLRTRPTYNKRRRTAPSIRAQQGDAGTCQSVSDVLIQGCAAKHLISSPCKNEPISNDARSLTRPPFILIMNLTFSGSRAHCWYDR